MPLSLLTYITIAPTPYGSSLDAHYPQIVGQSLTLKCTVTTVRGITSRVDIVWSSDGRVLSKEHGIEKNFITQNFAAYSSTYIISPLSVSDDGRTYDCETTINSELPVTAHDNVTLDVIGMQ